MNGVIASGTKVIFLHLPKTAGSTLRGIIERQYGSRSILPLYESKFGEELAAIPPNQMDRLRVVMGHFYFGAHASLSKPSTYITVLRDPIDRIISRYYFVRRSPLDPVYDAVREMSLKEFAETYCDNDQTRLLAGKYDGLSFGRCSDDEMLDIAKRNLTKYFAVVGITEEFDRSLILMKRILGWRNPFYIRRNVTRGRPRKDKLPQETLNVIQANSELDLELYRYAEKLFQEQIRSQSPSFENEFQRFKKLNGVYGGLHVLLSVGRKITTAKLRAAGRPFMRHD
jgi:Galactose-3-O-sulfotransferase